MIRLLRQLPALALLCLIALPATAQDPPPGEALDAGAWFAMGNAAFARADYAAALTAFEAAIAAGSEGPAAHYNRAVCLYRLGDFAAAEMAFRALGRDFPQMRALADYNVGLALVRQGRIEPARAAFVRSRDAGDETVAALARSMLGRLPGERIVAGNERTIGFIDFRLGQDDNVALLDPLVLPAGQTTDSPLAELTLYLDAPVGEAQAWHVAASAFSVAYPDASAYDQTGINVNSRFEHGIGHWTVSIGPDVGRSYIDGRGFEKYLSGSVSFSRFLAEANATIELGLRHDETDAIEPDYGYVDGHRRQYSFRLDKPVARSRLRLDYRLTVDDRAGDGVSADRALIAITWRRAIGGQWFGDLLFEYRDTDYGRLVPNRSEQRSQIGFRALRDLPSAWRLSAEYRLTDNDSSDPAFDYERNRFALGMSRIF